MSGTDQTASVDRSAEGISVDVVVAVADAKGVEPTDLPPLYHVVDPDALDRLFQPTPAGTASVNGEVAFTMAGCDVVVDDGGRVTVTPAGSSDETGVGTGAAADHSPNHG